MGTATASNGYRLLWAGFFSIFAAGVGFSVRTGVLVHWAREYGFTLSELGGITGGGLTGFGVIIILGSLIADRVGYGKLMMFAFLMHLLSAGLQMATGQIYTQFGREYTYWTLYIAMFMFAIANGTCEVVVNPMVATLFPQQKTHYLNILHAGWPGGLIAGGLVSYFMNGGGVHFAGIDWIPFPQKVPWLIQMSMFLVPTFLYGVLLIGQHLPHSEASEAGVSYGRMLLEFLSPILLLLLLIHALVGYVELGTDSWISKITGSIMQSESRGLLLFVYTSGLMFILRFFAGPIEHVMSPLGLLCLSGVLGAAGLLLLGWKETQTVGMLVLAATIYALGKTFLWPTMLAIVSERFPKGGALTIGAIGGAGMLSAGLLGSPGIGFKQDYYASQQLKQEAEPTYGRYAAERENTFLGYFTVKGLDGSKVGAQEAATKISDLDAKLNVLALATTKSDPESAGKLKNLLEKKGNEGLGKWWEENKAAAEKDPAAVKKALVDEKEGQAKELAKAIEKPEMAEWWKKVEPNRDVDHKAITSSSLHGGRMALTLTAVVPATMAVLYLLLILYFKATGGYKRLEVIDPEKLAGGVQGPVL